MALQFTMKKFSTAAMAAVTGGTAGVGLASRGVYAEEGKKGPLEEEKPSNPYPRTTAAGFDPEALERGAKVLREINQSKYAKQVIEITRKQEETRQAEEKTKQESFRAQQAQADIERQRVAFEEQRKLNQQQAQNKAQMLRYEDELTRKRMAAEHEAQRQRNVELVKMQEESSQKQEAMKRLTEEQIQRERRQSERERAELERETLRVKALAEAEGRAFERRKNEDVYRRELLTKMEQEREKLLAAINTTFRQIGAGVYGLLSDREKLTRTVVVTTALAAGVYTTREGARVVGRYLERVLGQPSLVRESSRRMFPFLGRRAVHSDAGAAASKTAADAMRKGEGFGDVILHPSLLSRVRSLAAATANTKKHGAPFRNMVFYGPPGTGKTMAAKQLARDSGLDYALMTGGDVGPLGPDAVTKIHQLFDWAGKSRRGLLLFIDEADAFLKERNAASMSENLRSALNALLYRTGDQSRDIVLVVATNRPEDLDRAVVDRVDEALEFPLPGEQEREKLIRLYLDKYVVRAGEAGGWSLRRMLSGGSGDRIEVLGIADDLIQEAAAQTEGFSGRELAKLMVSMQGAAYGSEKSELTQELFREVLQYKVAEHAARKRITEHKDSAKAIPAGS